MKHCICVENTDPVMWHFE